jgi:hypothetical protein
MDKREFLKKGLLGTGIFTANAAFGNLIKNDIDELHELEIMGFNHLPNTQSMLQILSFIELIPVVMPTMGGCNPITVLVLQTITIPNECTLVYCGY